MAHRNDLAPATTTAAHAGEDAERLLRLRDAEIVRLETSLAEERRAALVARMELDQVKAEYEREMERQRNAAWTARLRRLFKR